MGEADLPAVMSFEHAVEGLGVEDAAFPARNGLEGMSHRDYVAVMQEPDESVFVLAASRFTQIAVR